MKTFSKYFLCPSLAAFAMLSLSQNAVAQTQKDNSDETLMSKRAQPQPDKTLLQKADDGKEDEDDAPHFKLQPAIEEGKEPHRPSPRMFCEPGTRGCESREDWQAMAPRYLQIGLGYVHSSWNKFSPSLKDGSMNFKLGIFRSWEDFDAGLAANFMNGNTSGTSNENLNAMSFGIEGLYHLGSGKFQALGGLGFHLGGYRAWAVSSDSAASITYDKIASGFLVGFTPQVGMRLEFGPRFSIDLMAQYFGYLDKPNYRVGGWGAGINLNFANWGR